MLPPVAVPNLEAILEDRMSRYLLLEKSPTLQEEELRLCAADPVYFLNNWAWTYDPREGGGFSSLPFLPVPKQEGLIRWIQEREERKEDGVVPKSRATGVTYTCCGYAAHGWLFRDGFRCGFGSRVIPYVDSSSNPKSIFWKIRDILRRLPGWMMPQGFSWKKHSTHANLINPANNASIMGEGGANIGRGDRTALYFLDEAAHVEHAEQVEAALSMTTNVRIDLSTPLGNGNVFAQKVLGGKVPCFPVHWRDVPFLTQEMYEKYKEKYGITITAQEWDIDFTASESGLCIPAIWVQAAIDLIEKEWYADWSIEAGLDVGEESDLSVNLFRQGPVVRRIENWTGCTTMETAWRARDYCIDETAAILRYDVDGIGCLEGSTLVSGVPVAELTGREGVRTLVGRSVSTQGYRKGVADLYRVRTRSGRTVTVTEGHRFLSPDGWLSLSRLSVGSLIAADDSEDERRHWGKPKDSLDRYSKGSHPYDESPPSHPNPFVSKGRPLHELTASLLYRLSTIPLSRLSIADFCGRLVDLPDELRHRVLGVVCESLQGLRCAPSLNPLLRHHRGTSSLFPQSGEGSYEDRISRVRSRYRTDGELRTRYNFVSSRGAPSLSDYGSQTTSSESVSSRSWDGSGSWGSPSCSGKYPKPLEALSHRSPSRGCSSPLRYYRDCWDEIVDVTWVRFGEFYDLHVPLWEHYSAAGLWHHNSGIRGPLTMYEGKLPFKAIPVHFGGKPSETVWPDKRTSQEMFENMRAEMWWNLRCRFEKAYEFREKGIEHNPDDMISIPRHPQLIAQLSMPKYFHRENGKILLQPKKDLPTSPDFADACVLAFAPVRPKEFWIR